MDLFLIARCKHQITSKGTLGKYGSLLGDNSEKMVVLCNCLLYTSCRSFTVYIGDDASPQNLKEIVSDYADKMNIVYRRFDTNLGGVDLQIDAVVILVAAAVLLVFHGELVALFGVHLQIGRAHV